MLTLQEILSLRSNIFQNSIIKLVRPKDERQEYKDLLKNKDSFLEYQRQQGKDVFNCDYIVSFQVTNKGLTVLFGVFKVMGKKHVKGKDHKLYYDLEQLEGFEDLENRLVIDWGDGFRSWVQWFPNTKEVVQILPKGFIGEFSGLHQIVLEFQELERLIQNPNANQQWVNHLSSVNGIYLILDNKTGNQYIGSAYGGEGIWQRWASYIPNGHGNNKELKELINKDVAYKTNFKFSILQTLPSNLSSKEVIAFENLYKEKLGSKAYGLNQN